MGTAAPRVPVACVRRAAEEEWSEWVVAVAVMIVTVEYDDGVSGASADCWPKVGILELLCPFGVRVHGSWRAELVIMSWVLGLRS